MQLQLRANEIRSEPSRRARSSEQVTPTGSELLADSQGKTGVLESGGATGGAVGDDLEQVAADLRERLTADECRWLAELLTDGGP
jgi:hypothetical protein